MSRCSITRAAALLAALAALTSPAPAPVAAFEGSLDSLALPEPGETPDTSLFPIIDFVPDTSFVADPGLAYVIETGSRMYEGWKEERRVRLGERFYIADTEFEAAVTRLLPDFRLVDGRPVTASREMNNPAVQVVTYQDTTVVDSTWAFLNFPPHFSARAFFTFRLLRIEPADSLAAEGAGAAPATVPGESSPARPTLPASSRPEESGGAR
jgi:hypothetical protein